MVPYVLDKEARWLHVLTHCKDELTRYWLDKKACSKSGNDYDDEALDRLDDMIDMEAKSQTILKRAGKDRAQ